MASLILTGGTPVESVKGHVRRGRKVALVTGHAIVVRQTSVQGSPAEAVESQRVQMVRLSLSARETGFVIALSLISQVEKSAGNVMHRNLSRQILKAFKGANFSTQTVFVA